MRIYLITIIILFICLVSNAQIVPCFDNENPTEMFYIKTLENKAGVYFYNFNDGVEIGFNVENKCFKKGDIVKIACDNGTIDGFNEYKDNCTGDIILRLSNENLELLKNNDVFMIFLTPKIAFLLSSKDKKKIRDTLNCN